MGKAHKRKFFTDVLYEWLDKINEEEYNTYLNGLRERFEKVSVYNELQFMTYVSIFNSLIQLRYDDYKIEQIEKRESQVLFNRVRNDANK